jgi:hypothetical protein
MRKENTERVKGISERQRNNENKQSKANKQMK